MGVRWDERKVEWESNPPYLSADLMPSLPTRRCTTPGCNRMVPPYHEHRPSAAQRGYGSHWRMNRARYLAAHPLCMVCGVEATDVDHITPRSMGGTDEWTNLQPLCHTHHSHKTATRDGGFGK